MAINMTIRNRKWILDVIIFLPATSIFTLSRYSRVRNNLTKSDTYNEAVTFHIKLSSYPQDDIEIIWEKKNI